MTESASSASPEPEAAGGWSRRRRLTWVVVMAVSLVASVTVYWLLASHRTADQVLVRWAHDSPSCEGARVRPGEIDPFEETGPGRTAIVAAPSMTCTVTVEILNLSEGEVRVDRLIARLAGPATGSVVMVDPEVHPQPEVDPLSSERLGDLDAVIDVDMVLDAGGETAVDVRLVFNPDGCINGGTAWSDGWPTVELTTMRRTFKRPAADTYAVFHQGRTPGCRGG